MQPSSASHLSEAPAAALVGRAVELREPIREQAEEAEAQGHYVAALHEAFRDAGFYQLLTPKRYGGLEVDLRTFAKVIIEVGRGDPGTAWCLCLGQGHALTVGSMWPAEAQDEVFDNPHGYFRASHSLNPSGTAKRVEDGWLVNALSRYQSGVPYATHAIVSVGLEGEDADGTPPGPPPLGGPPAGAPPLGGPPPGAPPLGGPPPGGAPAGPMPGDMRNAIIPADSFTVRDDWGGDATLGMRSSGSNSVVVENVLVPDSYMVVIAPKPETTTSPGFDLHGNPLYLGAASLGLFQLELVSPIIGAARAALDEYEVLAQSRSTLFPPLTPRHLDPFYQKDFGTAKMKADSAEAIVMYAAETCLEWSTEAVQGVRPFTAEMDMTLGTMMMQAGELAAEAVDLLVRSAGTSAVGRGQRMQRYLRDVWMYRTHRAAQLDATTQRLGQIEFGGRSSILE